EETGDIFSFLDPEFNKRLDFHGKKTVRPARDLHSAILSVEDDRVLFAITHAPWSGIRRICVAMPVCRRGMVHGSVPYTATREEIELEAQESSYYCAKFRGLSRPDFFQAAHTFLLVCH